MRASRRTEDAALLKAVVLLLNQGTKKKRKIKIKKSQKNQKALKMEDLGQSQSHGEL